MRVAPLVELDKAAREALEKWANGRKTPVRLAERARIVLMAKASNSTSSATTMPRISIPKHSGG